jgi:carbonic anhydrase
MWGNEEPGRIFTCGNIGNRAVQRPDGEHVVSGDVLYPLEHTATDLAVVVGHTGCGAVTATYDALVDGVSEPPGIEHCLSLLRPQLEPGVAALPDDIDRAAAVNHLVEYNVDQQVQAIVDSDDVRDSVTVVGAVYDFQDVYGGQRGEVHIINIDGERDPDTLRRVHEEGADWIDRCWTY